MHLRCVFVLALCDCSTMADAAMSLASASFNRVTCSLVSDKKAASNSCFCHKQTLLLPSLLMLRLAAFSLLFNMEDLQHSAAPRATHQ